MPEPDSGPPADHPGLQVRCWACAITVAVPYVGDPPAPCPKFKCGWCGAINETFATHGTWSGYQGPQRRRTLWARLFKCLSHLQLMVVLVVFILISAIILLGVTYVLPNTCKSTPWLVLNHGITGWFTFAILYSYASRTQARGHAPLQHVFVSNCVGRANMRSFLLFMGYVEVAMVFCMAHTTYMLWRSARRWPRLASRTWHQYLQDWLSWLSTLITSSNQWPMLAALFIWVASLCVFMGVGVLLWSTVSHIAEGTTPITTLKPSQPQHTHTDPANASISVHTESGTLTNATGSNGNTGSLNQPAIVVRAESGLRLLYTQQWRAWRRAHRNVCAVMGGSGVADWLVPRWGPPPGVLHDATAKKTS